MKYESKEKLLAAVKGNIVEDTDDEGVASFYLKNDDADEWKRKYESEASNSQKQRNKKQEFKELYDKSQADLSQAISLLDNYKKNNPDELNKRLEESAFNELKLNTRVGELENELNGFRARETRLKIENALVEEANKNNVVPSAIRDVKRLAGNFKVEEDGEIISIEGGRSVSDAFQEELKVCPHWIGRSNGGGSTGDGTAPKPPVVESNANAVPFNSATPQRKFAAAMTKMLIGK